MKKFLFCLLILASFLVGCQFIPPLPDNNLPTVVPKDEDVISINEVYQQAKNEVTTQGVIVAIDEKVMIIQDADDYLWVELNVHTDLKINQAIMVCGKLNLMGQTIKLIAEGYKYLSDETLNNELLVMDGTEVYHWSQQLASKCQYVKLYGVKQASTFTFGLTGINFNLYAQKLFADVQDLTGEISLEGYLFNTHDANLHFIPTVYQLEEFIPTNISNLKNRLIGYNYQVTGQIISFASDGFLISDGASSLFNYSTDFDDYSLGDEVILKGVSSLYGRMIQMKNAFVSVIDNKEISPKEFGLINGEEINRVVNEDFVGMPVKLQGYLTGSGAYYNLSLAGSDYFLSLTSDKKLSTYTENEVLVEGYLLYLISDTYLYLTVETIKVVDNLPSLENTTPISIVEMNDVHGYIMQNNWGANGLSNVSYLIEKIRYENEVVLLANGDMFQGTGLVRMSYGQVMIDVMNAMEFDACGIGNHEFDWDLPMILQYFDGDLTNGEANFPLLNANIYQQNKLILDDNIYEYHIVEKAGIKVGLISYIGDVKSSINAIYSANYDFNTKIAASVNLIGAKLKDLGADLLVVSIHDGDSSGINNYAVNRDLAKLTYNGEYLVDAVINGHTHTEQKGEIKRASGLAMPVIQSSPYRNGYFNGFGEIKLYVDNDSKDVIDYEMSHHYSSDAGSNYDEDVEAIIDEYYEKDKQILTAEYCENLTYASKYDTALQQWVTNVMLEATGADVAICNTGGLRTNLADGIINFEAMYQFNPFDNEIIYHEASYSLVNNLINNGYYIYSIDGEIKDSGTYTVAVIDYVYYGRYYASLRNDNYLDTNLILRDLLIEDLSLRESVNFYQNNQALIGLKLNN